MSQNLFVQIRILFEKNGDLDRVWSPFMVNRFFSMSFDKKVMETAFKIDKYLFTLDKHDREMLKLLYMIYIPKMTRAPFIKYIKKASEKEENFKEIIKTIQTHFHWTDKETAINTPTLLLIFKNKDKLRQILEFIGAPKSFYKKYGIIMKEIPKEIPSSLARWSNV